MAGGGFPERLRAHARAESGVLLIEALIAISIFALVATGLVNVLVSSTNATTRVKQQTLAEQGVMNQIEKIRALDYNAVGTVNGCVPGSLNASTAFTGLNNENLGVPATLNTSVAYAGANVPGSAGTGADYKQVSVWITRNQDSKVLAQATTDLAPKNLPSQTSGTIKAVVSDYGAAGSPLQGVQVQVADGPSGTASCTSDSSGSVTFPGLIPNPTTGSQSYYDLTLTPPAGYQVLSDDVPGTPPPCGPPASPACVQLSPTQFWSTTLSVYKSATIIVDLLNPDGSQYSGPATVTVTSNDARTAGISKGFSYTGTPLSITNVVPADSGLVPGQYSLQVSRFGYQTVSDTGTVPAGYPTTLTSTFNETMTPVTANGELDVTVTAKKPATGATYTCTNATVKLTDPNNVTTQTTTSSGMAKFLALVPGGPYSVLATSGVKSGSASNITVNTGPTTTPLTIPIGTVSSC